MSLDDMLIAYDEAIEGGRYLHVLTGPEEIAKAYLVHRLVRELGYPVERLEMERSYVAGRRAKNFRARVDLILAREDGTPFYFVEAKAPEDCKQASTKFKHNSSR